MAAEALRRVTEAEYLAMLKASPTRLEFIDGEVIDIHAMAGGNFSHGVIPINVASALSLAASDQGCVTASSDVAIRVGERRDYCFPDLSVVCEEPDLDGDVLLNPTLVVVALAGSREPRQRTEVRQVHSSSLDPGDRFRLARQA